MQKIKLNREGLTKTLDNRTLSILTQVAGYFAGQQLLSISLAARCAIFCWALLASIGTW